MKARMNCTRPRIPFALAILAMAMALATAMPAYAQTTWYVDDNAINDPGPGDSSVSDPNEDGSIDHPFDAIQEAINASTNGDTVEVADGTYTGTGNKNIHFNGKYISVRSIAADPTGCIIDCQGEGTAVEFSSEDLADSILDGFTITNGYNSVRGGGIRCVSGSSPTINNCIITANAAGDSGGGIYCASSNPSITNCIINNNNSVEDGAAMYCTGSSPTITNCLIVENTAADKTGGIHCYNNSSPAITNCTIANNSADSGFGGAIFCASSYPTITNCIFWNNSPGEISVYSGAVTATYSDIEGGYTGTGNIDANPMFTSATDFRLRGISPCIDIGTNSPPIALPFQDLESNPRLRDGDHDGVRVVDMGAYEMQIESSDCNSNGIDDGSDIAGGTSSDCNNNLIPDECDLSIGVGSDCNENDVIDSCEIDQGLLDDCQPNGTPDICEIAEDPSRDCDENLLLDSCEIYADWTIDCNENGQLDSCDIADGLSLDNNSNGIPDECALETGHVLNTDTTIAAADLMYDNQSIIVDGCTLTIEGMHLFASLELINGAVVTGADGWDGLRLAVSGDLVVNSNCRIVAPHYNGHASVAQGECDYWWPDPPEMHVEYHQGSGGGHGGAGGGDTNGPLGGEEYGNSQEPTTGGGSGGCAGRYCNDGGTTGGDGGGMIRLDVAGILRVDGRISANGADGEYCCECDPYYSHCDCYHGGGGAGGSIYLTAGAVAGTGTISAIGGYGDGTSTWDGGGYRGGGGRVAMYYRIDNSFSSANISVSGYEGGTVYTAQIDELMLLADCLAGPNQSPAPSIQTDVATCLTEFDFDADGDVDLSDFALFQVQFVP